MSRQSSVITGLQRVASLAKRNPRMLDYIERLDATNSVVENVFDLIDDTPEPSLLLPYSSDPPIVGEVWQK
jgi:hypothetical protein